MGRPQKDVASSSHSLHSIEDAPPPYSDDPEPFEPFEPSQSSQPAIPPLRLIDSAYVPTGAKDIRPDDKVALTLAPQLSQNSEQLFDAISTQIKLPPRPLLYIKGTHTESSNNKKDKNSSTVTDFDFRLDLAETLLTGWDGGRAALNWMTVEVRDDEDQKPAYRGGIIRSRTYKAPKKAAIHLSEDSDALLGQERGDQQDQAVAGKNLRLWCERFCNDPAPVKSFTLRRELGGFDSNAMRNVFSTHIRELNYRGTVNYSMVIAHHSVTIYSPHWINRLRANRAVWWAVVILQLWIIAWPIIFFMEKRYEIASTRWHSSLIPETDSAVERCYARGRNESALAEYWAPAVKQAAWSRRQGGSEVLTRMDADRMQGYSTQQVIGARSQDSESERERRERVNSGQGGFVDGLVGLARGIGEVRQDWRMSMGWGANS
ncbi:unnamed protein product [Penicillium olsonii]|uniref:Uncharacterized protein n=1 Tax=Penicillium olsonii TaxID=99116 RepID=A0A9W4N0T8_PENOL|nr:unnamed protein product [Penicillium olsonii]CAG8163336.1 unnamed protein product [Penicillium olsonii]CAG8246974.1 unnamed protein product [Penicillium olsonii]